MVLKVNRNMVIAVGIMVLFILVIISITMYFGYQHEKRDHLRLDHDAIDNMTKQEIKDFLDERMETQNTFHSYYIIPFAAFVGLLIGILIYYLMSDKVIQQDISLKKNAKIILNFLTGPERKVIETLLDNNGKVNQYELSHLPNLNKLKTHRILSNLEQKGIIKKERLGRVNKIILNKELYEVLK